LNTWTESREQHSSGTAFLLWLACLFGACGIHRFYLGRYGTGLLYLLTFGLLGVGQVLDLFWMRRMVREADLGSRPLPLTSPARLLSASRQRPDADEDLRMRLVRAASQHGGRLSVSQGVMATGKPFKTVEALLDEMARSGHVDIDNDPVSGAVVYTFGELSA